MEPAIRHVRFFNGQFLKQDEFNEEQTYAKHMRRRVNYALFEDGVVEVTTADLTIVKEVPSDQSNKRIRITRGMAVGANQDVFESREIILPTNSPVLNLADTFGAGSTIWVSVNYRSVEDSPVAVGSTSENSRVDETAEIRLHSSNPTGTFTAGGDPFVVLGSVEFSNMNLSTVNRKVAKLRTALLAATPTITLGTVSGFIGSAVTMTITSNSSGGPDLSGLTNATVGARVTFASGTNVTGLSVVGTPTATQATVSFTIASSTTPGTRNITVTTNTSASAPFTANTATVAPTISSISPAFGTRNTTTVTITGTGFAPSSSVRVRFTGAATDTAPGTINSSGTVLTVVVQGDATSGPITVIASGGSVVSTGSFTAI